MSSNLGLDSKTNTLTNIGTTPVQLSSNVEDNFISALFCNMDSSQVIYLGKSDVVSGGTNGFAIQPGYIVDFRANGNLTKLYAVAGGGSNLKLSYILFR